MKMLSVTRAVIAWAVSLHLRALQFGLDRSAKKVVLRKRDTDDAATARDHAERQHRLARQQHRSAQFAEDREKRRHDGFRIAVMAEAASLRRGHKLA